MTAIFYRLIDRQNSITTLEKRKILGYNNAAVVKVRQKLITSFFSKKCSIFSFDSLDFRESS